MCGHACCSRCRLVKRLAIRNFSEKLRSSGVKTGGSATLGKRDTQKFANALDTILRKAQTGEGNA